MFGVALLVFREVLEAALIVAVVAAATRGVPQRGTFVGGGIALGVLGALIVAAFIDFIGGMLDGTGQEVFQATVLLSAAVMIGWHVTWMAGHAREMVQHMQRVGDQVRAGSSSVAILLGAVALAVLREGSEIVLYLYGMAAGGVNQMGFFVGIPVGLAIGVAVGFALYFGLLRIPMRYFFTVTNWMLVVLASGLASSASVFLVQADVLPALHAGLWDSSWLLTNHSIVGQALHILAGYDARPMGIQLLFWLATFAVLSVGMRFMAHHAHSTDSEHVKTGDTAPSHST